MCRKTSSFETIWIYSEEVKSMRDDPPSGYFFGPPTEFDGETLKIGLRGPWGTDYEGGCFLLEIIFTRGFMAEPPTLKFITPVYHFNVDVDGYVRMNELTNEWKPQFTLRRLLDRLRLLLSTPQLECPAHMSLALQYVQDPITYAANAKHWTREYAFAFDSFETYRSLDEVEKATTSSHKAHARSRFYDSVPNNFACCNAKGYPHERNCAHCDAEKERNQRNVEEKKPILTEDKNVETSSLVSATSSLDNTP